MKGKFLHFLVLLLVAIAVIAAPILLAGLGQDGVAVQAENPLYTPSGAALAAVLEADSFEAPTYVLGDDGVISYRVGMIGGRPVGAVFVLSVTSWNPGLIFLVGVDYNSEISGLEIIQILDTPGFYEPVETAQFRGQFVGNTAGMEFLGSGTAADNQVAAASGATVSSRALFDGAYAALEYFVRNILPTW